MSSARFSLFTSSRKVSIALATSVLLFMSLIPDAAAVVKLTPGVHFFCSSVKTKDLSYGGAGNKAKCKTNSTSFGVVATTANNTKSLSNDNMYFCIDFNTLDILWPSDVKAVNCKENYNIIYVSQIDPAKFPRTYHYICADVKTANLIDGGFGSIPIRKTVASDCFSVATTTKRAIKTNSKVNFICIDYKTKSLYYGGSGSKAKCMQWQIDPNDSNSFAVAANPITLSPQYICVDSKSEMLSVGTNWWDQTNKCKSRSTAFYVTPQRGNEVTKNSLIFCINTKQSPNLYYGGKGTEYLPNTINTGLGDCKEGSGGFALAAATTNSTAGINFEIRDSYLLCADIKTKVVTHPMGNQKTCGKNSVSFSVGAKGQTGDTGLTGATGLNGSDGKDGKTLWNGTKDPETTWGAPGDMYINATAKTLFGPKNLDGTWPAGVSMVGPKGDQGPVGLTGATGPQGPGGSGPAGPTGPAGAAGAAGADGSGAINTVLSNFGQIVKINSMTSNFRDRSNQKLRIFFSIKNLTGSTIVFVPVGDMSLQIWVNYFNSAGTLISGVGSPTLTWNETPAGLTVANGGAANFDVTVDNTSNFESPPAGAVSFSLTFRGLNLDTAGVWNTYFMYGMNGQYGPITSFAATPY